MNTYSVPILIVAGIVLVPTVLIFLKNTKSSLNRSYSILGLSIFIWLIGDALLIISPNKEIAILRSKIGYTGVILIPLATYYFVIKLLDLKNENIRLRIACSVDFIFLFLCNFTNLFTNDVNKYSWGYYPKANYLQTMNLLFYLALFNWSLFLLFSSFKKGSTSSVKKQNRRNIYVLLAFGIAMFGGVNFIPVYGIDLYPFGYLFMLFFLSLIGYAIYKYRLMEISIVFTRTGIFIFVYSLVLGMPIFLIYFLQNYLATIFGVTWWIVPYLSSVVLSTLGPFIYLYIDKKAEDRLLKEQKSYQNILRNASSDMIRIKDLNRLLNLVVRVVAKTVKLKHASIYLFDKEANCFVLQATRYGSDVFKDAKIIEINSSLIEQLVLRRKPIVSDEIMMRSNDEPDNFSSLSLVEQLIKLNAALVVPSFVEDRLIGILILGEKVSGKQYSADDLLVFSVLANQAALAIENAQFYNEVKLTHQQLFQAEKMATIGTMADGLSHQINNRFHALSLISGDALDLLKTFNADGCNDETKQVLSDLKNSLERIEANVLQGGEVVKGLLKYSRPGEGGFDLIDFKDVLKGAIDMVQYKVKLKEIDLIQNLPEDLSKFNGNLTQLQEVFFNLIDNAYDAIKDRQTNLKEEGYRGKIEISALNVNGDIQVMVADNGIGVKDLDRKKLFTPFFTTKATAKKGTGLGLYVIEKIVTSHNGKIAIDSVYKSGTTFTITLPIKSVS